MARFVLVTRYRGRKMVDLIYKEECYAVIGSCLEVHSEMGVGFLERVYQECLQIEFNLRKIPAIPHCALRLQYKDRQLETVYVPDFSCYDKLILEIKSVSDLNDLHRAQMFNYLRATGCRLGLLVNFGKQSKLQWERLVM